MQAIIVVMCLQLTIMLALFLLWANENKFRTENQFECEQEINSVTHFKIFEMIINIGFLFEFYTVVTFDGS